MKIPQVEATWCAYLGASTQVNYPVSAGTKRVTLLSSVRLSRVSYQVTILVELWANPTTSDTDSINLHDLVVKADSNKTLLSSVTAVDADIPRQLDDPDSDLDRYQFMVTYVTRTV